MLKGLVSRLLRPAPPVADLIAAGNRAEREGRIAEACALYRQAIAADPVHASARLNLGAALEAAGDLDAAENAYRGVLVFDAANAYAHYNLANIAQARGAARAAVGLLRTALGGKPDFPEARVALSNALDALGESEEALSELKAAIEQRPDYAGAWLNYGLMLRGLARADEAEDALRRAIELVPGDAAARKELGTLLRSQGRIAEALQTYAAALERAPDAHDVRSAELYTLLFSDAVPDEEIFARHVAAGARLESGHAPPAHRNAREPDRRLRIGYLAPELCRHPVGLFLVPMLERRDRAQFQAFCYHTGRTQDGVTAQLRGSSDGWRDAAALGDAAVAQAIEDDGIDILVDLIGHAPGSRLGIFARRPAPVQLTWQSYLHSTGLRSMQYRLCDAYTDPPGVAERVHTETLVRLPDTQWCYRPFLSVDAVTVPPCMRKGFITFGSFNHGSKISPTTRRQWREILQRQPDAHLVLVGIPPSRGARELARDLGESRIRFVPRVPLDEYYGWYNEVDIALDTTPYSGGTTTCDALWMGVPVVTAPGSRAISRSAGSLLRAVGLEDWIAPSSEEYAALAVARARDPAGLAVLRAGLRQRVQNSPVMDENQAARHLESAYRRLWRRWCEGNDARLV
jgi:predicted O-linked N-acetylglucosamine transferase (SPINDLY family)